MFSSAIKAISLALLLVCLCEGFNIPLAWGRRDTPNCLGVLGNRDLFEDVSRICSDCQNIYREKNIESKCRSECFTSPYFETCIRALDIADKLTEYKMHASILKEGRK